MPTSLHQPRAQALTSSPIAGPDVAAGRGINSFFPSGWDGVPAASKHRGCFSSLWSSLFFSPKCFCYIWLIKCRQRRARAVRKQDASDKATAPWGLQLCRTSRWCQTSTPSLPLPSICEAGWLTLNFLNWGFEMLCVHHSIFERKKNHCIFHFLFFFLILQYLLSPDSYAFCSCPFT